MKFGIFYIPQGQLFDMGSSILGYDIRQQITVPMPQEINLDWVKNNFQYGFHMTITDVVEIEKENLNEIAMTLQKLLQCFPKDYRFILQQTDIAFWEKNPSQAAIRFKPSESLIMLHTLFVCLLQSRGSSSFYLKQIQQGNATNWTRDMISKTELFYSPYIFDEFKPHFSLLNPFSGENKQEILDYFTPKFNEYKKITMESLCIVVKDNLDACFRIYKEFPLFLG